MAFTFKESLKNAFQNLCSICAEKFKNCLPYFWYKHIKSFYINTLAKRSEIQKLPTLAKQRQIASNYQKLPTLAAHKNEEIQSWRGLESN